MARREVDVRIGATATPVGRLIVEDDGRRSVSTFLYHASWIDDPRGFDLAPSLPRQAAAFYGRGGRNRSCLPGAVDDGAPDSWGRKILEKTSGNARLGDLDYLIGTDDFLRVGALRYFDRAGPEGIALAKAGSDPEVPTVPRLHQMDAVIRAARAFEADPEGYAAGRADLVGGDILRNAVGSLGGARPKINAIDEHGGLWIVKLPKQADTYGMARVEALALRLAAGVGIRAAEAHVINDAPRFPMIRIRRFDRVAAEPHRRIPYISAMTFMTADEEAAVSYADIAFRMRAHAANARPEIHELYRRMVFSILIRNTDDHLRNHGFLRSPNGWVLSPAFDINPEHRPGGMLQTPISPVHGADCSIDAALDAAEFFDLSKREATEMIGPMARTIRSHWRAIGQHLEMSAVDFAAVGPVIENDDLHLAANF